MRELTFLRIAGASNLGRVAVAGLLLGVAGCSHKDAAGTPEALIKSAWSDFQIADFQTAAVNLQSALHKLDKLKSEGHPALNDRALRINAIYGLGLVGTIGRAGGNAGGSEQGRRYLQRVIAMEGKSEMAAWAALALVRDEHLPQTSSETIDIPRLRTLYQALIDQYPQSQAAGEAFVYLQSLYVETLEPADAGHGVAAIRHYLARNPQAPFRSALYTLSSQAEVILKNYPAALQDSIQALETKEIDPSNPAANNILEYYRIGLMAQYDVGDFATARRYYHKFLEEYPTDQRAFNVKLELARMDRLEQQLQAAPATAPAGAQGARPALAPPGGAGP